MNEKIYTGYEDGLICCYSLDNTFLTPLIGHTNRINTIIDTVTSFIITTSNDCSIRQWDYETGACMAIFKFADPISCALVSLEYNMIFTASWDKMIRCINLQTNKVEKSFIASKEAIKCIQIHDDTVFVAGCDPIIRSFNLTNGSTRTYTGHKGWIYTIKLAEGKNYKGEPCLWLYSGGDDRSVIIWNVNECKIVEQLFGHENGVTSIDFAAGDLFTGSFDHMVI